MSGIGAMAVGETQPACRFAYSACTAGVGAVLTSHPDPSDPSGATPLAESWAPASLPIIGGRSGLSPVGPVDWPSASDPVLHFDRAETVITGRQLVATPGAEEYETIIRKTVTNLNVLNRVIASIGVEIKFHYRRRGSPPPPPQQRDPITVSINWFQPFVISTPGVTLTPPLPNPITLNQQIPVDAGNNFHAFRPPGGGPGLIDAHRPGTTHHRHEHGEHGPGGHGHGVIMTALVEPQDGFTLEAPCEFGRRDVPGLGRIYVGEWGGQPYRESFTFLRVVFDGVRDRVTPRGTFSGQIVIDDDGNGTTIP